MHESANSFGVLLHIVCPVNIGLNNGIIIVRRLIQSNLITHIYRLWPSSPTHKKSEAVDT